eukprot:scaffold26856_cov48-Cyclotella_meneghiniana.AAC.2
MKVSKLGVIEIRIVHAFKHLSVKLLNLGLYFGIIKFVSCDVLNSRLRNYVPICQGDPVTHVASYSMRDTGPSTEFPIVLVNVWMCCVPVPYKIPEVEVEVF